MALGFVVAMVYSFVLLVFTVWMLPASSPPSEGAALSSSFFFWLVGASTLWVVVAGARREQPVVRSAWFVGSLVLLGLAVWIGPRFERARLDSCVFGAGGGEQSWCTAERDSLPGVSWAWVGAALASSLLIAGAGLLARRLLGPETEPSADQSIIE